MFSPNIQPPPLVSPDNNGRQFKPGIFLFVLGLVMIVLVLILNDFSSFAMELAFIFGLISLLFFLLTINQDYGFGPIMKIILAVLIVGAVGLIISNFYYVEHEPLERNVIEFIYQKKNEYLVKLFGETKDVNYYDGSKPNTKVEIEGWFTLKRKNS